MLTLYVHGGFVAPLAGLISFGWAISPMDGCLAHQSLSRLPLLRFFLLFFFFCLVLNH